MKKRLILAAAAALALSGAGIAQARDLNWSVSIGDPLFGAVISNGRSYGYDRGYVYEPRVYVAPPVVYAPPPRVIYQRPYVYAPVVPWGYSGYVVPRGYYQHDRWDHRRYEEPTRYWRGDDRHDRREYRDRDDRRGDRDDHGGSRDERRQRY